jgi:hypothetical protein
MNSHWSHRRVILALLFAPVDAPPRFTRTAMADNSAVTKHLAQFVADAQ